MAELLLIEDNEDLALGLETNLGFEGHRVRHVTRAEDGLALLGECHADLVVLDMMLPGLDGFEFIDRLRATGASMPVLCLTARSQEVDKVRALRSGADDYLTKPFGLMELLARIEALLRRAGQNQALLALGPHRIDREARTVSTRGEPVTLSPREFDLLLALIDAEGAVLTRQELLASVWGHAGVAVTRTVDTHIAELRRKLERDPSAPEYIITVRKVGYLAIR